ncbi:hypothetical protein AB7M49_007841 [Bradyrhizobium elkanii]
MMATGSILVLAGLIARSQQSRIETKPAEERSIPSRPRMAPLPRLLSTQGRRDPTPKGAIRPSTAGSGMAADWLSAGVLKSSQSRVNVKRRRFGSIKPGVAVQHFVPHDAGHVLQRRKARGLNLLLQLLGVCVRDASPATRAFLAFRRGHRLISFDCFSKAEPAAAVPGGPIYSLKLIFRSISHVRLEGEWTYSSGLLLSFGLSHPAPPSLLRTESSAANRSPDRARLRPFREVHGIFNLGHLDRLLDSASASGRRAIFRS